MSQEIGSTNPTNAIVDQAQGQGSSIACVLWVEGTALLYNPHQSQ